MPRQAKSYRVQNIYWRCLYSPVRLLQLTFRRNRLFRSNREERELSREGCRMVRVSFNRSVLAFALFTTLLSSHVAFAEKAVSVLPWDGTSFDDLNSDGSTNYEGIAAVTTRFYQSQPDAFDFL